MFSSRSTGPWCLGSFRKYVWRVFKDREALNEELGYKEYETKTRDVRKISPARPAAEGIYTIVRFGEFHFFKAIRDENGDLQSLQGFVCHLQYLLHHARNYALELRLGEPLVLDEHQIFKSPKQSCDPGREIDNRQCSYR